MDKILKKMEKIFKGLVKILFGGVGGVPLLNPSLPIMAQNSLWRLDQYIRVRACTPGMDLGGGGWPPHRMKF